MKLNYLFDRVLPTVVLVTSLFVLLAYPLKADRQNPTVIAPTAQVDQKVNIAVSGGLIAPKSKIGPTVFAALVAELKNMDSINVILDDKTKTEGAKIRIFATEPDSAGTENVGFILTAISETGEEIYLGTAFGAIKVDADPANVATEIDQLAATAYSAYKQANRYEVQAPPKQ